MGGEEQMIVGGEEFDQALAVAERGLEGGVEIVSASGGPSRPRRIDVVFLEAFEAGKVRLVSLSVDEQAGEALFERPFGDLGVVAFFRG